MSELLVDLHSLEFLGKWLNLASLGDLWKSEHSISGNLGGLLNLFGSRVVDLTLLDLSFLSWEEDELGLIVVKSLDVLFHLIGALVMSSVI